ncbi:hypothetical protein LIER_14058 [Lithospermum erythrorhizon]|uniref:Uncharacterized protein n=1 Tax=Lithospermum erythrorhizon TaxID=34254 RepID=A0AAV3Q003_LITER
MTDATVVVTSGQGSLPSDAGIMSGGMGTIHGSIIVTTPSSFGTILSGSLPNLGVTLNTPSGSSGPVLPL